MPTRALIITTVTLLATGFALNAVAQQDPTAPPSPAPAAAPAAPAAPATAKAGEKQTTPSGLTIVTVASGDGLAKAGDTVWVHYTGTLQSNGTKFDSSLDRGDPISFTLGQGEVIKGWDEGIAGMKVGDKRQLIIPPTLGYGEKGAGNVIPPNATLVFDVELMGVKRP